MAFSFKKYTKKLGVTKIYRTKWFFLCIFLWTLFDFYILSRWENHSQIVTTNIEISKSSISFAWIGLSLLSNFLMLLSLYFVIFKIKEHRKPLVFRIAKILLLIFLVILFVSVRYLLMILVSNKINTHDVFVNWWSYLTTSNFIADIVVVKCLVILCSFLIYQLSQKYSPRFFIKMVLGKYANPKDEERIIMFIDLRDSTPISEQLGHKKYFLFIRDFINTISNAALECGGDIYQYVGDEVIVTWPKKEVLSQRCIQTLILGRKYLGSKERYFKDNYGFIPEFRAGIHVGEVTIGEIGILKKDIAISGEAMNMTARIRSACNELNQKHIVSEDYFEFTNLKIWQGEDLGVIHLKGLNKKETRLYGLKI